MSVQAWRVVAVSYPIPNPENGLSMAQRAAEQPCHPFANCTGFGVLAFELHDTGPIVKTARIFHQTPQSPHNLRQTSMYRHYDNTMPSHDYLKKHITLQLSHCTLVVIVIIPSIPGTCGTTLTKWQNGLPVTRMPSAKNRWSSVTPEPPKAFAHWRLWSSHQWSSGRACVCQPMGLQNGQLFIFNMLSMYTVYRMYIYTYWLIKLALRGLRFRRWAFMRGHLCLDMHIHSQTKMIINVRTWKGYIYIILLYYMKLYYIILYIIYQCHNDS